MADDLRRMATTIADAASLIDAAIGRLDEAGRRGAIVLAADPEWSALAATLDGIDTLRGELKAVAVRTRAAVRSLGGR